METTGLQHLVPTLCVGTQSSTLRVVYLPCEPACRLPIPRRRASKTAFPRVERGNEMVVFSEKSQKKPIINGVHSRFRDSIYSIRVFEPLLATP